jgi:hypothetical protein
MSPTDLIFKLFAAVRRLYRRYCIWISFPERTRSDFDVIQKNFQPEKFVSKTTLFETLEMNSRGFILGSIFLPAFIVFGANRSLLRFPFGSINRENSMCRS